MPRATWIAGVLIRRLCGRNAPVSGRAAFIRMIVMRAGAGNAGIGVICVCSVRSPECCLLSPFFPPRTALSLCRRLVAEFDAATLRRQGWSRRCSRNDRPAYA